MAAKTVENEKLSNKILFCFELFFGHFSIKLKRISSIYANFQDVSVYHKGVTKLWILQFWKNVKVPETLTIKKNAPKTQKGFLKKLHTVNFKKLLLKLFTLILSSKHRYLVDSRLCQPHLYLSPLAWLLKWIRC